MKHIKVVAQATICRDKGTGCGECQSSCQSACKTSCTVGNQACEQKKNNRVVKEEKYWYILFTVSGKFFSWTLKADRFMRSMRLPKN